MSGYTALMQQNEQLATAKRRRVKEVLETLVAGHHGKILQYYGDGSLSIFNSAIDGVNCAVEIQQTLQQEPKVELRIGIHTGDISIEGESIYGDGIKLYAFVIMFDLIHCYLVDSIIDTSSTCPKRFSQPLRVFVEQSTHS